MEPAHTFGPRTTATSNTEGRLKVDAGGRKKRILKEALRKVRKQPR